ncbi:glucose-1-phosphate thymidylyltransferase RfbA [Candidatus Uabimicrobium amorphum]|uniref:Glucose-1-phosphate thymidylyltransferase n=1 Tax=Uabimicrobium amorphum TaxID=2596890 RepID=A0A5S9F459_UABAM|nr:glucose-1-phosphate thymidylyltransferase RfbA [Candidatus Uabimicrobium amorphum]BBM85416.1 glucose-1-phosphate thymidylyltransferase [Candidatus Uabimicrobium amorphum]
MKGIILAGGKGTRLYPATKAVCKQLMPIYDKPMIYYPLSILMLAKIREILIIGNPQDIPVFRNLFQDGSSLGLNISYAPQPQPNGIAEAFIIGEKFIGSDRVCLILGDNIFYGEGLGEMLQKTPESGATVFGYNVPNPERYGVINFDENGQPSSIVEKPQNPKSNVVVAGLYFYDNRVIEIAKSLKPSARGELEIAEINDRYLQEKQLNVNILGRGFAWLDTGSFQTMLDASNFIRTIEERQGLKIACIEEVAYQNSWISAEQVKEIASPLIASGYGKYLLKVIKHDKT